MLSVCASFLNIHILVRRVFGRVDDQVELLHDGSQTLIGYYSRPPHSINPPSPKSVL
jgi:hypothetical protein